jgi:hypothetical protein
MIWVDTNDTGTNILIDERDANFVGAFLSIEQSNGIGRFGVSGGSTEFVDSAVVSGNGLTHLAGTYDPSGPEIAIYQNGQRSNSKSISQTGIDPNDVTTIGQNSGGVTNGVSNTNFINAVIDDTRIYDTVKTDTEINQAYNNTEP